MKMLRVYEEYVAVLRAMAPLVRQIARFDVALATQLRRSGASVALRGLIKLVLQRFVGAIGVDRKEGTTKLS